MTREDYDQYERVCRAEFCEIRAKLNSIDKALRGNGTPGMKTQIDRLEAKEAMRVEREKRVQAFQTRLLTGVTLTVLGLVVHAIWQAMGGQ